MLLPVRRHGDHFPDRDPVPVEVDKIPGQAGAFLPVEAAIKGEHQRDPEVFAPTRGGSGGRDQLFHIRIREDLLLALRRLRKPRIRQRIDRDQTIRHSPGQGQPERLRIVDSRPDAAAFS